MNHHHHQNHPPSSLPSNPNPEPDPSLPCNGYHKISLPLLRRCMSDPCNPPSATASNPSFFDPSLSSASRCGGSLPNFTPPYSPDRHHCPKTPSHSPTHALPPLPPPHTFRRSVSDINPSPSKASSRFSTSSQDLGTDIDTPNSKRLRRMKDRLREMSHWCQQLMRAEDLMEEDEDEQQQAVEEDAQVQAVDATDQDVTVTKPISSFSVEESVTTSSGRYPFPSYPIILGFGFFIPNSVTLVSFLGCSILDHSFQMSIFLRHSFWLKH
ncbi:CREB-binding protein-like isoform X2 [Prunus avium]|uniref:CREB-binding protein-like isoform X2 n=1 Tax=Prunus avium TaxID=42229 RepID=A0A6P5S0H7_PRUAV|nr:CREB-binding protein-like isoform X2 [Prunus avium]